MGEKETATAARAIAGGQVDPTPAQARKQGPEKKEEEQRYVGKHSPELMRGEVQDPPEELSDTGRQDGGSKSAIQNIRA